MHFEKKIKLSWKKRLSKIDVFSKIDFVIRSQKYFQIYVFDLKPSKMNFLEEIDIKNTKHFCLTPSSHEVMLSPTHATKMKHFLFKKHFWGKKKAQKKEQKKLCFLFLFHDFLNKKMKNELLRGYWHLNM